MAKMDGCHQRALLVICSALCVMLAWPPDASSQEAVATVLDHSDLYGRIEYLEGQVARLTQPGTVHSGVNIDCQSCELTPLACPTWSASLDGLYWKPRQRGLDYAVTEDGSSLILGQGQIHNLDFDRDSGFRLAMAHLTKTGWTVRAAFTMFDTDGSALAQRPDGVGQLFATRSHPSGTSDEAETATAFGSIDYKTFDLTAERFVFQNRFASVATFAGIRWVEIDQQMDLRYDGRDFDNGRIWDQTNMDGFGLRMGSQSTWHMAKGFSLFGSLAGGLTYGRHDMRFSESNIDETVSIVDVRDQYDEAVGSLEAMAGLNWTCRNVSVGLGYEMIKWFNVGERSMFVDNVREGAYASLSKDLLLEGLFVNFTVTR